MKEKYYDFTTSITIGIILISLSISLFIGKTPLYHYIIKIIIFILWLIALRDIVRLTFRKQSHNRRKKTYLSCLFHLIICIIFSSFPNFALAIAPFFFAIYLSCIALSQFITCYLELKNKDSIKFSNMILGILYLIIALPILKSPVIQLNTFLFCLSSYILLLGISILWDSILQIIPYHTKNSVKRKIKITLPKIIEAMIPYSILLEINHNLEVPNKNRNKQKKQNQVIDLNILVHISNRGANRMGHIDIYFENEVISYGNYDEGSRFCHEIFGDGILFITNKKKEYINFCIDNSKKTIFDFGISLTPTQHQRVKERIQELKENTYSWDHRQDRLYNKRITYAEKLYRKTQAKFYKFKKGKYRTFFVLGTNCCFLADDIIGHSGSDILSMNGIITPGTYYDYLNRQLKLKNSNVISKEIYNAKRRAN